MIRIIGRFSLAAVVFSAVVFGMINNSQAQDGPPPPSGILEGFAVLPADTFAEGPASGSAITEANGFVPPFESQPVQGVSALIPAGNGNYYAMSDNGFGAKGNSPDYILRYYEIAIDFEAGTVDVLGFTQLSDPNRVVPFPIMNEDSEDRLLTGADFDIESFRQAPDGTFWFGEEFGPYLLHVDANGVLLDAPIPTPYPDVLAPYSKGAEYVQSPDNPAFVGLATPEERNAAANGRGSRGFEGMAITPDGSTLYPLMEGPLSLDPLPRLLIQEFDIATASYTGVYYFYPMSSPNHAIGEMTAINDTEMLVIERDNNQGADAAFKRIYRIDFSQAAPDGVLTKTLVVDLMNIGDPNGITTAEEGAIGFGEVFTFPFVTIEAVYPIDADTILVSNDNNFPFSSGRRPGVAADNNEFILIGLLEPLNLAE